MGYTEALLMIADKYDIKSLFGRCESELAIELSLEKALGLLDLSKRISAGLIVKKTIQFIGNLDDAIRGQEKYNQMTAEDKFFLSRISLLR